MADEDIFRLDKNRLDSEWQKQVETYGRYALKLADARRDHAQAKAELELVEAELDRKVRMHPADYGLDGKVTETVIAKTIILQKPYRKAQAAEIEAKHNMDVVQAFVNTLDHKKKALEDMVRLRLADYFAEPRASKEVANDRADRAFGSRDRGNNRGR